MAIWSLLSRPPAAARPSDLWFWAEPCEVASLAGAEMAESQRFHVVLSNQNNCENTILEGEKKKKNNPQSIFWGNDITENHIRSFCT